MCDWQTRLEFHIFGAGELARARKRSETWFQSERNAWHSCDFRKTFLNLHLQRSLAGIYSEKVFRFCRAMEKLWVEKKVAERNNKIPFCDRHSLTLAHTKTQSERDRERPKKLCTCDIRLGYIMSKSKWMALKFLTDNFNACVSAYTK